MRAAAGGGADAAGVVGTRRGRLLRRAAATWCLIIAAESVHGALRHLLLVPSVGDRAARQIGFVAGAAIVLAISAWTAPWMAARTRRAQVAVGGAWMVLLACFEVGLAFTRDDAWRRLRADYDPREGGLMALGLVIVLLAPMIGAAWRGVGARSDRSGQAHAGRVGRPPGR